MADDSTSNKNSNFRSSLGRFTIPPLVNNRKERSEKWGLPENDTDPGEYIIELNLLYEGGMGLAFRRFQELYKQVLGEAESSKRPPMFISKSYYKCSISVEEIRKLVSLDEQTTVPRQRAIYKIWPDFPVEALIDRSTTTVKADAALRAYDATGEQIVWAVIDSGINGKHIHFGAGQNPQILRHALPPLGRETASRFHDWNSRPGSIPE